MDQIPFPGCFVCGPDNPRGLAAVFKTLDSGDVEGVFVPHPEHCGYEGVVHGGIIMGFLDEALGRLSFPRDRLFLTHTLEVSFRKAAVPGAPLKALARLEGWSRRQFTSFGEVTDASGDVVATARGRFLVMNDTMEKRLLARKP